MRDFKGSGHIGFGMAQYKKGNRDEEEGNGSGEAAAVDEPDQYRLAEQGRNHAQCADGRDTDVGVLYVGCRRPKSSERD